MSEGKSIIGRWRITEMDNWDQEAVDLVQPGFIEFDDDGLGGLGFIVVTGELDSSGFPTVAGTARSGSRGGESAGTAA